MATRDERIEARVKEELTPVDLEQRFDDTLDEIYGPEFEKLGGPFSHMTPSDVLRKVDPVAHRRS